MIEYTLCARCDHFVDANSSAGDDPTYARFVHLDDGEKDHDHDAEPSDQTFSLDEWKAIRPDLFERDPATGRIGPNREQHQTQRLG